MTAVPTDAHDLDTAAEKPFMVRLLVTQAATTFDLVRLHLGDEAARALRDELVKGTRLPRGRPRNHALDAAAVEYSAATRRGGKTEVAARNTAGGKKFEDTARNLRRRVQQKD